MTQTDPPLYSEIQLFPADFSSLKPIGEFLKSATETAGFDHSTAYGIQLAVDEACSNIIEHAYGSEGSGEIECTCTITSEALEIQLHDHGEPFNPAGIPQPDTTTDLEQRTRGGLGLFFIRQLMDEVLFRFEPAEEGKPKNEVGNFLVLKKFKGKMK